MRVWKQILQMGVLQVEVPFSKSAGTVNRCSESLLRCWRQQTEQFFLLVLNVCAQFCTCTHCSTCAYNRWKRRKKTAQNFTIALLRTVPVNLEKQLHNVWLHRPLERNGNGHIIRHCWPINSNKSDRFIYKSADAQCSLDLQWSCHTSMFILKPVSVEDFLYSVQRHHANI